MCAGIGVGPLNSVLGRLLTRWSIALCSTVQVRDPYSFEVLRSIGVASRQVTEGVELTFLEQQHGFSKHGLCKRAPGGADLNLGISIVPINRLYSQAPDMDLVMVDCLVDAINSVKHLRPKLSVTICVFCTSPGYSDEDISAYLDKGLQLYGIDSKVVRGNTPEMMHECMGSISHFIGTRYHSIVFAYQACLPILPVIYHDKCSGLANQLGIDEANWLLANELFDATVLREKIARFIEQPDKYLAKCVKADLASRAEDGFSEIVSAIKGEKWASK